MKKTTILSALAVLLLAACTQDELTDASNDLRPVTITATIDPQIQSRATVSDSETPTRCFLEISDVDGDYNEIIRLDPTESTFTTALLLSPTSKYNLLLWADNVNDPFEGYLPPSLHYMEYTEGSLAYRVRLQNQSWSANGIKCGLKHAVAKVTLRTTADLPAGRNVTMTIPTNYPCYSMYWDDVCSINASQFNPRAYTTPAKNDAVSAGGDVVSCYVLVPTGRFNTKNNDQKVKISHDGLEWTIPDAIPIKQNQHTIISGDVSKVGYSDFTYTVTTESMGGTSAGYDETWSSNIPDLPFEKQDLTQGAINITQDGIYHITSNGTTTSNAITISGNISPKIYISDLNMAVSSGNAISITGGASATIFVMGENSVTSSNGAGVFVAQNSTVTITGNNRSDVLTVTGNNGSSGIGGYVIDDSNYQSANSGNINIENVTLYAYSSSPSYMVTVSPGIGSTGSATCQSITIDNAAVYAYGCGGTTWSAPAIGNGMDWMANTASSTPTVTISNNSEVHAHRGERFGRSFADYIGRAGTFTLYSDVIATVDASSVVYKYTGDGNTPDL